ncbi:MAG: DUF1152 domain-containing protein [Longimonas sp.]|uniref:DUF1152 domain-containing protein n=1 Tax=Longimonas sp. TaxID=2039626 RepID=UPI003352D570
MSTSAHALKDPSAYAPKKTLVVAGGGGGDALAALMVARTLNLKPEDVVYATIVWERTIYDPQPGPRGPEDFETINEVGRYNHAIGPQSALAEPAVTFIPRLADAFDVTYYLMNIRRGAVHVQQQVKELHALHGFEDILVVDVGGDILARGDEETLRSPTADGLTLAGMHDAPVDVRVAVTGFGLDGELTDEHMREIHDELPLDPAYGEPCPITSETASAFMDAFQWLPSEVSGMTCASALGYSGTAEIRSSGLRIRLNEDSHTVRVYPYEPVWNRNRVAQDCRDTTSLDEVEAIVRSFGLTSEMDYERRSAEKLEARGDSVAPTVLSEDVLQTLDSELMQYSDDAKRDGVDYLSIRRIAKVLGLNRSELNGFKKYLADTHPDRLRPPVWVC